MPLSSRAQLPNLAGIMSTYSRREFVKLSAVATMRASLLPVVGRSSALKIAAKQPSKPGTEVAGVRLSINVPFGFGNAGTMSGDDVLKNCVELGLSAVELRMQPVETFLEAFPPMSSFPRKRELTPPSSSLEQLAGWRKSVSLDRVAEFRKTYETAGVLIEIVKVDNIFKMTDDELDFVFANWPGHLSGRTNFLRKSRPKRRGTKTRW